MTDDWLLWQLIDSAFPSGGFAHSCGLEAAYQNGIVTDGDRLLEFLDAQLRSVTYSTAPFVMAAFQNSSHWLHVDRECDLFLSNHVANRASRAQGGALLAAVERVFGLFPSFGTPGEGQGGGSAIWNFKSEISAGPHPNPPPEYRRREHHFAAVFGAVLAALGVAEARAAQVLLFLMIRGGISSAVRLGIVGPMEGQSIQHALGPSIDRWAQLSLTLSTDDAAQTSPALDLFHATHDRLYSRLFQS